MKKDIVISIIVLVAIALLYLSSRHPADWGNLPWVAPQYAERGIIDRSMP